MGQFKVCFCTPKTFSGANRRTRGHTAGPAALRQTTLIKFVRLDSQKKPHRHKEAALTRGTDTQEHRNQGPTSLFHTAAFSHDEALATTDPFSTVKRHNQSSSANTILLIPPLIDAHWIFLQYFLIITLNSKGSKPAIKSPIFPL